MMALFKNKQRGVQNYEPSRENFSRATIQQICTFLLYGGEGCFDRTPCPYKQHKENAYEEMTAVLREKYPDEMELDKVVGAVGIYTGAIEEIYFEIGFRIGLQLAEELRDALLKEHLC